MRRALPLLLAVVCIATTVVAQQAPKGREFVNGPLGLLLTDEEKAAFAKATTDRDAEELIRGVWAHRARPDASAEQVRLDYEARVAAADKQFAEPGVRGALTDRGRTLLLLGMPDKHWAGHIDDYLQQVYDEKPEDGRQRNRKLVQDDDMKYRFRGTNGLPTQSIFDDTSEDSTQRREGKLGDDTMMHGVRFDRERGKAEVWFYTRQQLPAGVDVGDAETVNFPFLDRMGEGRFGLETSLIHSEPCAALLAAAPAATLAATLPQGLIAGSQPASADQLAWFAIEPRPWPEAAVAVAARGIQTPNELPLWVLLRLPADGPQPDLLAGRLLDADGAVTGTFQVAPKGVPGADGVAYELAVPAGGSAGRLEVALAAAGQPLAVTRLAVEAAGDAGPFLTTVFTGSELEQVPSFQAGAPFVFGGYHLRPAPGRTYRTDESLKYFCLLSRPALGADGQPSASVALRLLKDGVAGPLHVWPSRPAGLSPVSPEVFMFGSELPMSIFKQSGSFRLEVTVRDEVSGVQRSSSVPFTVEVASTGTK